MAQPDKFRGRVRVLHIGGASADPLAIQETFTATASRRGRLDFLWAETLYDGLARLKAGAVGAVLLDLGYPDDAGIEAVETLRQAAPGTPILVFGTDTNEETAGRVLKAGAHDYLIPSRLDGYWWPRLLRHVIARTKSEQALGAARDHIEVTLDALGDAVLTTDRSGRVTYLNKRAETITGWSRSEAAARPLGEVLGVIDRSVRSRVADPLEGAIDSPTPSAPGNRLLIRRDGAEFAIDHTVVPLRDHLGSVTGNVIVLRDVSVTHVLSERMAHLASHDPLTDLPNRRLLGDRLARALEMASRHRRQLAVLYIDIDRFKHINDSLGHQLGDELLQAVARDTTLCVRSSDTVSRLGGDEFVVVLSEMEHVDDAAIGAQKIIEAIGRPRRLFGHEIRITVSIGISVYPNDGEDGERLLRNADLALYHAKDMGRDGYQFYERGLHARAVERRSVEADLHRALEAREFELHYQPKVALKSGAVVGAEALIRWRHPTRGLLAPADFVSIAEDCGLMAPVGQWVVAEACRQAREWQHAGIPTMPVSVNVSAVELRNRDFLKNINDNLDRTGLAPHYLEIEITEGASIDRVEVLSVLRLLKDLGVRLAIDDFGTGWSSLSCLSYLPIDTLKIDKSFLEGITADALTAPIASTVIAMARSLKYRVIAEGVESEAQLAFLTAENCDEAQGYYFSSPCAAPQFVQWLDARHASQGAV